VDRREFLKTAGLGIAATTLGAHSLAAAEVAKGPAIGVSHFVPVEKGLAADWLRSLFARGTKEVLLGRELTLVGMPVGGIATGQLYLCGDGTLGCWEIFNRHKFPGFAGSNSGHIPDKPIDQGFAVVVEQNGERSMRALNEREFEDVTFTGTYPIGTVKYRDEAFPAEMKMEVFSPFIPLNAKDSALPATVFSIKVKNISSRVMRAGCLGWLENAVCHHAAQDVRGHWHTRIERTPNRGILHHSATEAPREAESVDDRPTIVVEDFEGRTYGKWKTAGVAFGKRPARGPLPNQGEIKNIQGKGLANSFLREESTHGKLTSPPFTIQRKYINFLIGGGDLPRGTSINLLIDGIVARSSTGMNGNGLVWDTWDVADLEGTEAVIEIVDKTIESWGYICIDQIEMSDRKRRRPDEPFFKLPDWGTMALGIGGPCQEADVAARMACESREPRHKFSQDGEDYAFPERRNGALMSDWVELAPGEEHSYQFVLAWHFPNHADRGHEYAARFADAGAVANYVLDHAERLVGDTITWRDSYYDSTLPYWLLDRVHSTLSYLATGTAQWWVNGRFWAFEGVVCCEGTCTHVWNYAQAHARLFPELAQSVREMQDFSSDGGGFHEDTGLVGFRSDDKYAADGQCGTVLKAYREHLMSPDDQFLRRNWPKIKKVLEYSIAQDKNEDGLIENSQHNTYDVNFSGANTFVGALYLAALRAGEAMALEMGELEFAQRVRGIYERGQQLTLERLWDGEYFIQDVDAKRFPQFQYGQGCLSDQLFGQTWAHQVGLGYVYPEANVKQTLASIWKYNWAPDVGPQNEVHKPERCYATPGEAGLFICTWPKSAYLEQGVRYREEVWTGIEYQVATNMIWDGMVEEGLAICRAIHDRYHPLKRNPYNEVECSDHYARALASWGVLLALCGFEYHGPKGHIGFAPRVTPENFKCAFTAAEGWGSFEQTRANGMQHETLAVKWGTLRVQTLAFAVPETAQPQSVTVQQGEETLRASFTAENGRMMVALAEPVTINLGQALKVKIKL